MKKNKYIIVVLLLTFIITLSTSCNFFSNIEVKDFSFKISLNDGDNYKVISDKIIVCKKGDTVSFDIEIDNDYEFDQVNAGYYDVELNKIVIENVMFGRTIILKTKKNPFIDNNYLTLTYDSNEGEYIDCEELKTKVKFKQNINLEKNSSNILIRNGYIQIGWNTESDGTGKRYNLGERISIVKNEDLILYAEWEKCLEKDDFEYITTYDKNSDIEVIEIIGFSEKGKNENIEKLVIPETIDGKIVCVIGESAFANDLMISELILNQNILIIKNRAFSNIENLKKVILWENLTQIDNCFDQSNNIEKIQINATLKTIGDDSYPGQYSEKYLRLKNTEGKRIILISGSSMAFGINSPLLEAEFSEYKVVNMGLNAIIGSNIHYNLVLSNIHEGDIIIVAPEHEFNYDFFNMEFYERNYGIINDLDIRNCRSVLENLAFYFNEKREIIDNNGSFFKGYLPLNEQGDVAYERYAADYIERRTINISEAYSREKLAHLNWFNEEVIKAGAKVYYSFPMFYAQEEQEQQDVFEQINNIVSENLDMPVISNIFDYNYYNVGYFYDSVYHPTTEGAIIRTNQLIKDIRKQLKKEGQ